MAKKKTNAGKGSVKRLVVLDSHAILHRAYHALPDFISSKGEPTGALYGLILTLMKIVDELKPDYIVAARDLPGKTHRHELFEEYKGTRTKADDALVSQLIIAPRVFEAFGIPVYSAAGYEADDVLGTIVHKVAKRSDVHTIIASGDMDTLQLVSPQASVYTMRKGLNDTVIYDTDAVIARFGFGPELLTDFKGLRGDPSDNIPGVKGVGEESAMKMIRTFGSIEQIRRTIQTAGVEGVAKGAGVQKRYAQLIADHIADAVFSKDLATIKHDAPISFAMPENEWQMTDHAETIAKILDELEFRSLKDRLKLTRPKEGAASSVVVDPMLVAETALALWLLHSDMTTPTLEDVLAYAQTDDFEDARTHIFEKLKHTGRLQEVYERIERPLMPVIKKMNETGILLDTEHLAALAREYTQEVEAIAGRIYRAAGREFNINSPKQLATVLFEELQLNAGGKQKKTASGAFTTREDELVKLAEENPIVADVLAYRELQKLLGTYIEKMPGLVAHDGRLHAEFLQAGTTTGRMASQNPNLQNIPIKTEYGRRIREAFAAPEGFVLVAIDYSQIELRIAAGLSHDEKLVEIFTSGADVHAATAAHVFGVTPEQVDKEMRRRAKVINFGILYGMGVNALRANLGAGVSREEAGQFLANYFGQFSGLARFVEEQKAFARTHGYTETLFGRRRYFSGFKSPLPGVVAQAERMAVNAPIQGTQADIIKLAMVEADKLIAQHGWQDKARLLLQVHDELVYEVQKDEAEQIASAICSVMEQVVTPEQMGGVPVTAEIAIGENWGETKRIRK